MTVKGLQIINGAQTVYSIYKTYRDAATNRNNINNNAFITLRLLKSGGKDFDLNVTRYTNSQNPINERDFHANDDIQVKLQNDFFDNTDIWYERRRSEFRKKIKGVVILSNEYLSQTYLAYSLQDPLSAKNKSNMLFKSEKIDEQGLYEKVFHSKIKYDDMLASHYIYDFIESKRKKMNKNIKQIETKPDGSYTNEEKEILKHEFLLHSSFHILSFINIVLLKNNDPRSISGKIISSYKKNKLNMIEGNYNDIIEKIKNKIEDLKSKDQRFTLTRYFKSANSLELKALFS